jgi:hypothetical protein
MLRTATGFLEEEYISWYKQLLYIKLRRKEGQEETNEDRSYQPHFSGTGSSDCEKQSHGKLRRMLLNT